MTVGAPQKCRCTLPPAPYRTFLASFVSKSAILTTSVSESPRRSRLSNTNDRLWTPETIGIATAFVLGALLTILDATIVNVALPTLAADFHASIATIQWVPTIYLLTFAAVIPLTGWASERFGAKRVWLTALTLFLAGSLLCAASNTVAELLAARVLQGLGGGMVMPVGQTMLARVAGPHRTGRVMSVVGVPMLL